MNAKLTAFKNTTVIPAFIPVIPAFNYVIPAFNYVIPAKAGISNRLCKTLKDPGLRRDDEKNQAW